MDFQRAELEEALETLVAILQDRRTPYDLLAIGGSGLLLLGLIDRPTGDLDIIALLQEDAFRKLDALPEPSKRPHAKWAQHSDWASGG